MSEQDDKKLREVLNLIHPEQPGGQARFAMEEEQEAADPAHEELAEEEGAWVPPVQQGKQDLWQRLFAQLRDVPSPLSPEQFEHSLTFIPRDEETGFTLGWIRHVLPSELEEDTAAIYVALAAPEGAELIGVAEGETLADRLGTLGDKDLEQDGRIQSVEEKNEEQDGRLYAVEAKNEEQDGRLDSIELVDQGQDSRLDAIELDLPNKADKSEIPQTADDLEEGTVQKFMSQGERDKLAGLESSHFKGEFVSKAALEAALPTAEIGDYAYVDTGAGQDTEKYIWDDSDSKWVLQLGESTEMTPAQVKAAYESNLDTNAFTDAEKLKLAELEPGGEDKLSASANLSDLTNVVEARTNLNLGDSATLDVGTTAGTVAAGDDSRIVGAARKSANLSDLSNAAAARVNLGLGNVATGTAVTGNMDTTAGRIPSVGWLGLGGTLTVSNAQTFASLPTGGNYTVRGLHPEAPIGVDGALLVVGSAGHKELIYFAYAARRMYFKEQTQEVWAEVYSNYNPPPPSPASWASLTGKPSTFAPSSHTHPWSQVTGAPATATRWPSWGEVTGKPGTFPAAAPTSAQVGAATAGLGVGAVGTYALMYCSDNTTLNPGSTRAGTSLRYANAGANPHTSPPAGSWRLMGYNYYITGSGSGPEHRVSLWLRYA